MSEVWYRVNMRRYKSCGCDDTCHHATHCSVDVSEWYVLKHTPCGVWLTHNEHPHDDQYLQVLDKPRWVSATSKKRWAYPTKREAYQSFVARKQAQHRIISSQLSLIDDAIHIATAKLQQETTPCSATDANNGPSR